MSISNHQTESLFLTNHVRPGRVHVLVVEDDDGIAEPLAEGLIRDGFAVSRAASGAQALQVAAVDVVLLDLGLPDMDGYALCRQLRLRSAVPILVITARGSEADRVVGLELGADDYLVKPFGFRELVARIRAVLRRSAEPATEPPQVLGALTVDRRTRRVLVAGNEVTLSPKEYDLLALLAEDPGAVVSRQTILEEVWDPHWYGPTKTLDVHVASLRRKLGAPEWIQTVRRVGLRLGDTRLLPATTGDGGGVAGNLSETPTD
jgi:DNA-binding response OmpR family regulator